MFTNPKKLVIVAAGVLTMSLSTRAYAASTTYTDTASDQQTDFTKTLSLPQFNPGLGTLLSVTLTYGEDVTNSGKLSHGNQPLEYKFTGSSNLMQSALSIDQTASITESGTSPANSSTSINDFQTKTGGPITGPLSYFTGNGNIDFTLTGTGTSQLTGGGNISNSITTMAGGFVTVTYNYTPVPEASTLLGLGGMIGLGGLHILRRMRKKA